MVEYNEVSNNEIKSIENGSMKKDLKKIINENNLNKDDLMEIF